MKSFKATINLDVAITATINLDIAITAFFDVDQPATSLPRCKLIFWERGCFISDHENIQLP